MIDDENIVLTDDELIIAGGLLTRHQNMHVCTLQMSIIVDLSTLNKNAVYKKWINK